LQDGSGISVLQTEIRNLTTRNRELEQSLSTERKENSTKLKDKDETITFLMGELARLKQEQSPFLTPPNDPAPGVARKSSGLTGFLSSHHVLSLQQSLRGGLGDDIPQEEFQKAPRRGSISNLLPF